MKSRRLIQAGLVALFAVAGGEGVVAPKVAECAKEECGEIRYTERCDEDKDFAEFAAAAEIADYCGPLGCCNYVWCSVSDVTGEQFCAKCFGAPRKGWIYNPPPPPDRPRQPDWEPITTTPDGGIQRNRTPVEP